MIEVQTEGQSRWVLAPCVPAVPVVWNQTHNETKWFSFKNLKKEDARLAADFQDLYKAARPTNNCQGDFVPLFLQHGNQCRVAHAHGGQAIHGHDHVSTPGQRQTETERYHFHGIKNIIPVEICLG